MSGAGSASSGQPTPAQHRTRGPWVLRGCWGASHTPTPKHDPLSPRSAVSLTVSPLLGKRVSGGTAILYVYCLSGIRWMEL